MTTITDPAFPGLKNAQSPELMLRLMRGGLRLKENFEITEVVVNHVYYQPGEHCSIQYRVLLKNLTTGRISQRRIIAYLLQEGEDPVLPTPEQLSSFSSLPNMGVLTPTTYLTQEHMVLYTFPIDPDLPSLVEAFNPVRMRQEFNLLWSEEKASVRRVTPKVCKYRSGSRLTLIYEVATEIPGGGPRETGRVIGKINPLGKPDEIFTRSWALWRATQGKDVNLPKPLAYLHPLQLMLQEFVEGQPLSSAVESPSFPDIIRQTARSIVAIHQAEQVPFGQIRNAISYGKSVRQRSRLAASLHPEMVRKVKRLENNLMQELERGVAGIGPIHGDFHPGNVLVQDDHVTLIDLDLSTYGERSADIGCFLANLRRFALVHTGRIDGLEGPAQIFLDQYLALMPEEESRINLYEACYLVRAANSHMGFDSRLSLQQSEQKKREAEELLDLSSKLLLKTRSDTPGRATTAGAKPVRPRIEPQGWATDPTYMTALLCTPIKSVYDAYITSLSVDETRKTPFGYQTRYQLLGQQAEREVSVNLSGIAYTRENSTTGYTPFKCLEALQQCMIDRPEAPLLPGAVGFISPLSMMVIEPLAKGLSFSSVLDTPDALEAASRVAEALAILHQAPAEVRKPKELRRQILKIRREVAEVAQELPDLGSQASQLLQEVEARMVVIPERIGPSLRRLSPDSISLLEGRVGFNDVRTLAFAHPVIDLADLLAQLTLKSWQSQPLEAVVEKLRDTYITATGVGATEVALLEAAQFLGQVNGSSPEQIERILQATANRLATTSSAG
ncbi:MAG: aminoglycoside phosphotransferase family protein [Dehalococcoidia bacterium]